MTAYGVRGQLYALRYPSFVVKLFYLRIAPTGTWECADQN